MINFAETVLGVNNNANKDIAEIMIGQKNKYKDRGVIII